MSNEQLPIEALVCDRCAELGLRPAELIRRCGYKNVSKGLRRLEQIRRGDFGGSATLIRGLPIALGLPTEAVTRAVEDTQHQIHEAEEAAWRAAFVPHAIILTERERPTQIFVAAILGVDRLRRVDFDLKQGPVSYTQQALDGVREKLARWKSDQIPTFGHPTGIVINYSPDHAVRFDLEGKAVEVLDRAYRLGEATFSIGKRPVSSGELAAILGQPTIINLKGYGNRRGIASGLVVDGSNTKSGSEIHRDTTPKSPRPKPLSKSQIQKRRKKKRKG